MRLTARGPSAVNSKGVEMFDQHSRCYIEFLHDSQDRDCFAYGTLG